MQPFALISSCGRSEKLVASRGEGCQGFAMRSYFPALSPCLGRGEPEHTRILLLHTVSIFGSSRAGLATALKTLGQVCRCAYMLLRIESCRRLRLLENVVAIVHYADAKFPMHRALQSSCDCIHARTVLSSKTKLIRSLSLYHQWSLAGSACC
eukprot:5249816-Amphidinium_carterae.1